MHGARSILARSILGAISSQDSASLCRPLGQQRVCLSVVQHHQAVQCKVAANCKQVLPPIQLVNRWRDAPTFSSRLPVTVSRSVSLSLLVSPTLCGSSREGGHCRIALFSFSFLSFPALQISPACRSQTVRARESLKPLLLEAGSSHPFEPESRKQKAARERKLNWEQVWVATGRLSVHSETSIVRPSASAPLARICLCFP